MRSLGSQFRTVTPILLIAYLFVFLSLLAVILISTYKDIALDRFTQDPTALMKAPFYLGAFSNIGIMLWSGAAAICLFGAFLINYHPHNRSDFNFLFCSGLITLLMGFDDMYLLHEEVFPLYFKIPANAVILTYANIFIIYFIVFRRNILSSEYLLLALAFFFLGLSTIIDLLPLPMEKDSFLEDAIKLFGVVSWFIYYYRYVRYRVKSVM
jgi:hypothetical protein